MSEALIIGQVVIGLGSLVGVAVFLRPYAHLPERVIENEKAIIALNKRFDDYAKSVQPLREEILQRLTAVETKIDMMVERIDRHFSGPKT